MTSTPTPQNHGLARDRVDELLERYHLEAQRAPLTICRGWYVGQIMKLVDLTATALSSSAAAGSAGEDWISQKQIDDLARAIAAGKIGSRDPTGAHLPEDIWHQALPEARERIAARFTLTEASRSETGRGEEVGDAPWVAYRKWHDEAKPGYWCESGFRAGYAAALTARPVGEDALRPDELTEDEIRHRARVMVLEQGWRPGDQMSGHAVGELMTKFALAVLKDRPQDRCAHPDCGCDADSVCSAALANPTQPAAGQGAGEAFERSYGRSQHLERASSGDGYTHAHTNALWNGWNECWHSRQKDVSGFSGCGVTMITGSREDIETVKRWQHEAAIASELRNRLVGMAKGEGVALIAAERLRQIEMEGYTAEHDDSHTQGEMAVAAACYALPEGKRWLSDGHANRPRPIHDKLWPWTCERPKPSDRRRELVKAGALIVAEIERLDRLNTRDPEAATGKAAPLIYIDPQARAGKPPCGECHLRPGETCDICGAKTLSSQASERNTGEKR